MTRFMLVFALAMLASVVQAQPYPNRAIRIIVPWPPGQAVDLVARLVGEKLATALGVPVIVDNRPGAGGGVGTEAAIKAAADGYTLLAGSSGPISISPGLQSLAYSPMRDLAPISLAGISPFVLVTHPAFPAATAAELIATVKSAPGRYSFSSSGNGSTAHLTTEIFNINAGLTATHVPYRGSSAALVDVMSGQIGYTFESLASVAPFAKSGKLRALGISLDRRVSALPSLPPIAEAASMPGFNTFAWIGLLAPASTSRDIVNRLTVETQKAITSPDLVERLATLGIEAQSSSQEAMSKLMRDELERYGSIIKRANIKID